jgi:hypothetical protein
MNNQLSNAEAASESRRRRVKWDIAALCSCVLSAIIISTLPHLVIFFDRGEIDYIADGNEAYDLALSRAPYWGESTLRDPFSSPEDRTPSLYSWAQFVPLARLSRALGFSLLHTNILWRIVGGALFGSSLYILFRVLFSTTKRPTLWAFGCAVVCLSDPAFIDGRCFLSSVVSARRLISGNVPLHDAEALRQYRVVTPLLNLSFLLLFAASLFQTRSGRRIWAVAGAICLGLCFHLYFFYWTAAIVASGLYVVLNFVRYMMRRDERPAIARELGLTALIVAGGVAIGGGQVYQNGKTFGDEALKPMLERMSRGRELPPASPTRRMYLRNIWAWGKLAIGAAAAIWLRSRAIALLWCFTAAGFGLVNHAVVTGIEFENSNWSYVYSSFGEACLLASMAFAVDRFEKIPRGLFVFGSVVALTTAAISFAWRAHEALHVPETVWISRVMEEIEPLRGALSELTTNDVLAGPHEANITILFARSAYLFDDPQSFYASLIPDGEVHERHALNAWLLGFDRERYEAIAGDARFAVGLSENPAWTKEAVLAARLKVFDRIEADAGPFLKRYHPNVLFLRADAGKPTRGGSWRSIASSEIWNLWKRMED